MEAAAAQRRGGGETAAGRAPDFPSLQGANFSAARSIASPAAEPAKGLRGVLYMYKGL